MRILNCNISEQPKAYPTPLAGFRAQKNNKAKKRANGIQSIRPIKVIKKNNNILKLNDFILIYIYILWRTAKENLQMMKTFLASKHIDSEKIIMKKCMKCFK